MTLKDARSFHCYSCSPLDGLSKCKNFFFSLSNFNDLLTISVQDNTSGRFAASSRSQNKVDTQGRTMFLAFPDKRYIYRTKLVPKSLFQDLAYWLSSSPPLYAFDNYLYQSGSIKSTFFSVNDVYLLISLRMKHTAF